jgi:fructan beta-fructosidase
MSNWQYAGLTPSKKWRGTTTLPRTLELIENHHEYLLKSNPVEEFDKLKEKEKKISKILLNNEFTITEKQKLPIEIVLHFNTKDNTKINFAERFGIILSNKKGEKIIIGYDNLNKVFFVDKTKNGWDSPAKEFAQINYAPYINSDDTLDIRLIIDKSSVELFAKDGLIVMTDQFFPSEEYSIVSLFTEHGEVELIDGQITKLSSIWE